MNGEYFLHGERLDPTRGMTYGHTRRCKMPRSKVAISLDESTLERLDHLVERAVFSNRSQAIQIVGYGYEETFATG